MHIQENHSGRQGIPSPATEETGTAREPRLYDVKALTAVISERDMYNLLPSEKNSVRVSSVLRDDVGLGKCRLHQIRFSVNYS